VVTIVIIGVLSTLGFPQYIAYRERVLDREAQANLGLIIAAERIYRIETNLYYNSGAAQPAAIAGINTSLRLILSTLGNRSWDYQTTTNAGGAPPACAQASRFGGLAARDWSMRTTDNASVSGTCP
jgi:type II secretory pathway pseudopilin PulG